MSRSRGPRLPRRIREQAGRYALVDGIAFKMPVDSHETPALMAAFPINAARADELMPGDELHAMRIWGEWGLLLVTVVNYGQTDIGSYVEFSVAVLCTRGSKPAPPVLPMLLRRRYGFGQYVHDLPVSTEVSVRGGLGIWGMPKRQASLDFVVDKRTVSSQYDLDGRMVMRIEVRRPRTAWLPITFSGLAYSAFRGILWQSAVYFGGRAGLSVRRRGAGLLRLGDHPRAEPLRALGIGERPLFTAYVPSAEGVLDDHFEGWFLTFSEPPATVPEGLEALEGTGLGRDWLPPPVRSAGAPRAEEVL